ncbi:hypothetical protein AYI68_g3393, partial [Smittium mucronatum]
MQDCTSVFGDGSCYDIYNFSFTIGDLNDSNIRNALSERETLLPPHTRILQKHTGIEEVINNLERLSLSDKEKK